MARSTLLILLVVLTFFRASAQDQASYLKENAIRIADPEMLTDDVYTLLSPFQVIMFGEMHGTNESAPFVNGLSKLFTGKSDSVLVGLEIPPALMAGFLLLHTDSSIYQSDFFRNAPATSGRESVPWASLIAALNKNQKAKVFFFDVNEGEGIGYRDSLMAMKIKAQLGQHPAWKVITLSGNYHNKITNPGSMTSVLKRNTAVKICSLNMEYKEGSAHANFTHGMEIKELGSYPSVFNSTEGYDRYVLLQSPQTYYDYNGFYFTKTISPAQMTIDRSK